MLIHVVPLDAGLLAVPPGASFVRGLRWSARTSPAPASLHR
ncbi:hypothetical protein SFR_2865 [Streptomyces sp. FR-008]|nr:hypothetical protein SFR_2865 [Streptomyces sp. FR-008]